MRETPHNPFRPPTESGVFETRRRGPTAKEAATLRRQREAERKEKTPIEHLHSVTHLHAWLEERGHADACSNLYRCDPWKYEPILLEELYRLKISGGADATDLNELRGMIRAGSWMTYDRMNDREAVARLGTVRDREQADWMWKIRNADPSTAKELAENRDEVFADLDRIGRDLHTEKTGEALESAVSSLESLMASTWHQLKKAMAMHGMTWEEARKNPVTKVLVEEIDALRPVRDLAYFRRLYPERANVARRG